MPCPDCCPEHMFERSPRRLPFPGGCIIGYDSIPVVCRICGTEALEMAGGEYFTTRGEPVVLKRGEMTERIDHVAAELERARRDGYEAGRNAPRVADPMVLGLAQKLGEEVGYANGMRDAGIVEFLRMPRDQALAAMAAFYDQVRAMKPAGGTEP